MDLGLVNYVADRDDIYTASRTSTLQDTSANYIRRQYTDASDTTGAGKINVLQLADATILDPTSTGIGGLEVFEFTGAGPYVDQLAGVVSTTYQFTPGNVLFETPNAIGAVAGEATLNTFRYNTHELDINRTLSQATADIDRTPGSSHPAPVNLDHTIHAQPMLVATNTAIPLGLEIKLIDGLVAKLASDGYFFTSSAVEMDDFDAASYTGTERVQANSDSYVSPGLHWSDSTKSPTLEIPLSVMVGYLPLFHHNPAKDLKTMDLFAPAFGNTTDSDDKIVCAINTTMTGQQLTSSFASGEHTTIRPGKVVITQTMRNVKMYTTVPKTP